MRERKDNRYIAAMIVEICASLILWALLIVLRAVGLIDMHWALVLSGLVWIAWGLFALTGLSILLELLWNWLKLLHRIRILKRVAAKYGYKDVKVKIRGNNIEVSLKGGQGNVVDI